MIGKFKLWLTFKSQKWWRATRPPSLTASFPETHQIEILRWHFVHNSPKNKPSQDQNITYTLLEIKYILKVLEKHDIYKNICLYWSIQCVIVFFDSRIFRFTDSIPQWRKFSAEKIFKEKNGPQENFLEEILQVPLNLKIWSFINTWGNFPRRRRDFPWGGEFSRDKFSAWKMFLEGFP